MPFPDHRHIHWTLVSCCVLALGGCTGHERAAPGPTVATAWQRHSPALQTTATADRAHHTPRPDRHGEELPSDAVAIATVDGRPIGRRRVVELLLRSHGVGVLKELIVLDRARHLASQEGLQVSEADVDRELDRSLRHLVDPLSTVTADSFDRQDAERLLEGVLSQRNMSREEFLIGIRRNAYLRAIAESAQVVTEEQLRAEYDRAFSERVQVRHIQLATLREVTQVQDRLAAGEDFAGLTTRYSANVVSAADLGLLEPFSRYDEEVPALFRRTAFDLQLGQVSSPVRIDGWYHLLKLERVLPARDVEFGAVRSELQRRMRDRRADSQMQELYERLLREAAVEIFDPALRAAFAKERPNQGR